MSDDAMNDAIIYNHCNTRSVIKGGIPDDETAFVVEKNLRHSLRLMSYITTT